MRIACPVLLASILAVGCSSHGGSTNRPPLIGSVPPTTARVGIPYGFTITAVDPEKKTVTFSLVSGPAGMSVDAASGALGWTPSVAELGAQPVVVRATDPAGLYDEQSWTIQVGFNHAPAVLGLSTSQACVAHELDATVDAFDPDGDAIALSISGAPAGLVLDSSSGAVHWTPTSAEAGSHVTTISAADPYGLVGDADVTLDVLGYTDDPTRNTSFGDDAHAAFQPINVGAADGTTWLAYSLNGDLQGFQSIVVQKLEGGSGCPIARWSSPLFQNAVTLDAASATDGGLFVLFDRGSSQQNLYVTRLDAAGDELWTVPVTSTSIVSGSVGAIVADSAGVYVVFFNGGVGGTDTRVQKLAVADGSRLWSDGTVIDPVAYSNFPFPIKVVPVGDGGATACVPTVPLKCGRIASGGTITTAITDVTPAGGLRVLHSTTTETPPNMGGVTGLLHDATGYVASFVWYDFGNSKAGDALVRFDATTFANVWGVTGAIDSLNSGHNGPMGRPVAADTNGNFLFASSTSSSLVVDKLDKATGNELWMASASVSDHLGSLSMFGGFGFQFSLIAMGDEAIVPWITTTDIRAQRFAADGTRLWTTDGTELSVASTTNIPLSVAPGAQGHAIVSWQRTNALQLEQVAVQQVNPSGMLGD